MDAFLTFVGYAILAIGALVVLVGGLWFIVRAFQVNILLGVGTIIFPILANPIFLFTKWDEARHPFWVGLAGWGLCFLGVGLVVVADPDTIQSGPDRAAVIVSDAEEEDFEDFEFGGEAKPPPRQGFRVLSKKRERPPSRSDRIRAVKKLPSSVQFGRASVLLHEKVKVVKKSGNAFDGLLQEVSSDGVVVRQYFGSGRMDVPIRAADIDRIDWTP